jgi:hypothetical protein
MDDDLLHAYLEGPGGGVKGLPHIVYPGDAIESLFDMVPKALEDYLDCHHEDDEEDEEDLEAIQEDDEEDAE